MTPPTDRAQDQLRQPRVTGDFNLFTKQNIDTAPKDDLASDLESQGGVGYRRALTLA